jgi:hypothetical protein
MLTRTLLTADISSDAKFWCGWYFRYANGVSRLETNKIRSRRRELPIELSMSTNPLRRKISLALLPIINIVPTFLMIDIGWHICHANGRSKHFQLTAIHVEELNRGKARLGKLARYGIPAAVQSMCSEETRATGDDDDDNQRRRLPTMTTHESRLTTDDQRPRFNDR